MFWDNYLNLCRKKDLSANAVAKNLGIASGTVTSWKQGRVPHHGTLIKLADYFGVSVDYLLGKTEQKESHAVNENDIKEALFGSNTNVTDEMWREVLDYAEFIKQKYSTN